MTFRAHEMVISLRKHLRDRSFFLYLEMSSKSKFQYSKKTRRAIQKFLVASSRSSITNAESVVILISSDTSDKRYNMKSKVVFYLKAKRGVE